MNDDIREKLERCKVLIDGLEHFILVARDQRLSYPAPKQLMDLFAELLGNASDILKEVLDTDNEKE